jgi:hypothetical protein
MPHYYSIRAYSTTSLQVKDPLILIEPGMNAFTVLTTNVKALVVLLEAEGIRVEAVNALDGETSHVGSGAAERPEIPTL